MLPGLQTAHITDGFHSFSQTVDHRQIETEKSHSVFHPPPQLLRTQSHTNSEPATAIKQRTLDKAAHQAVACARAFNNF